MPGMDYMYDQPSIYLAMYRIDIWLYVVCGVVHVQFYVKYMNMQFNLRIENSGVLLSRDAQQVLCVIYFKLSKQIN